jgi:coenzyme F420-reducing hydrogenase delta subunit/DNA-binding transcriptional ArsR family regulator
MCTGRVDLEFVLRAFSNGTDGVFIGGCRLGECNYSTQGNYHALTMVLLCKKILEYLRLNPQRLRIEFMSSADGVLFTEVVNDFVKQIKGLGPLGSNEGIDAKGLKLKLEAASSIVPYIRLVERERLRVRFTKKEEYEQYFASDEANKLFNELIADRLAISQIMILLRDKLLSTSEIAEILGLSSSQVSKYLRSSAREGLIRFDEKEKRFASV